MPGSPAHARGRRRPAVRAHVDARAWTMSSNHVAPARSGAPMEPPEASRYLTAQLREVEVDRACPRRPRRSPAATLGRRPGTSRVRAGVPCRRSASSAAGSAAGRTRRARRPRTVPSPRAGPRRDATPCSRGSSRHARNPPPRCGRHSASRTRRGPPAAELLPGAHAAVRASQQRVPERCVGDARPGATTDRGHRGHRGDGQDRCRPAAPHPGDERGLHEQVQSSPRPEVQHTRGLDARGGGPLDELQCSSLTADKGARHVGVPDLDEPDAAAARCEHIEHGLLVGPRSCRPRSR